MAKALSTPGLGAPRERWIVIAGLACALALAALVGSTSSDASQAPPASVSSVGGANAARPPPALEARRAHGKQWVASQHAGLHATRVASVDPTTHGHLDAPRLTGKRFPATKRVDTPRATLAARLDAAVAVLSRRIHACALHPRHTSLADRPLTANCPAQGPPAGA